jgi:beta-xylosidase
MSKPSLKFLIKFFIAGSFIVFLLAGAAQAQNNTKQTVIVNGNDFKDIDGNIINAHGGCFLKVGKYYYWLGENRHNGVLVSCYRSTDLINWKFCSDLLSRSSCPELANANIERPKVLYNKRTKQYVMWMHMEEKGNYSLANAAVATSPDIEKPFTFKKSFRPLGNMSRDCTLYEDEDGTAYFISTTRENRDVNIYELTPDYLDIKEKTATVFVDAQREAPAVMKHNGYYFIMSSLCTGWSPNQAKYAFATSMKGPWSELKNIGSHTTFDTQPAFILPIKGKQTTSFLYAGDRWDAKHYFDSKYIFLPLSFPNDTTMELNWVDTIIPNLKTGEIITKTDNR